MPTAIEFSSIPTWADGTTATATGIMVPDDVVEKLGGAKIAAVEIPDDLRAALEAAGVLNALRARSFSTQRAFIEPVSAAKAHEALAPSN